MDTMIEAFAEEKAAMIPPQVLTGETRSRESAFFIPTAEGKRLFAFLHRAEEGGLRTASGTAIVYCNPLFEEHLCSHRISVNFARHSASRGYTTLRFDYLGDGESDGLFQEASISSRISDILRAVRYVKERLAVADVVLLGLRLGATLALLAAERDPSIGRVICWAPVINVADYFKTLLMSNIAAQMALYQKVKFDKQTLVQRIRSGEWITVDGYELGNPLYQEAMELDLMATPLRCRSRVLTLQIAPRPDADGAIARFLATNSSLDITTGFVKEEKFWSPLARMYPPCDALFSTSLAWLD